MASIDEKLRKSLDVDGIVIGYQDVDRLIAINKLPEVTNPVYLGISKLGKIPTTDGVLSYEIFGVGEDRKHRMAYIDLKRHYMNPNAVNKLKTFYAPAYDCLYGNNKYKLVDGELVRDDSGQTGGEFLYSVWDKLKFKNRSTVITKEVEDAFKTIPKNVLFFTKWPVIPAAYRDINTGSDSRISTNIINDMYTKLISYSKDIDSNLDGFDISSQMAARGVQTVIDDIYRYLVIEKVRGEPSKYGFHKRFVIAKNIGNTSRAVVTAPDLNVESVDDMLVRFGRTGIPLAQVVSLFFPFISKWIKDWFANQLESGRYAVRNEKGELEYFHVKNIFTDNYIHIMLNRFVKTPELRVERIRIPLANGGEIFVSHRGRFQKTKDPLRRPMTWTDLVYIAAEDVCQSKHVDVTRYPVTSENSQFGARIAVLSTRETEPVIIDGKLYKHYPKINESMDPANMFIDSVMSSNAMTSQLGMDFDGDQTSQTSRFTNEANAEAEEQINSKLYYLSISGKWMRPLSNEFVLTAYSLTKNGLGDDINAVPPMYKI